MKIDTYYTNTLFALGSRSFKQKCRLSYVQDGAKGVDCVFPNAERSPGEIAETIKCEGKTD